jgi:hypothetical protein
MPSPRNADVPGPPRQASAPSQEFIGERLDVEQEAAAPAPRCFTWRGQVHQVAAVLHQWVDAGFGPGHPGRSRRWYTRRHRRYFVVRDDAGDLFELYLDYADRSHRSWWLVRHTPAVRGCGSDGPRAQAGAGDAKGRGRP